MREKDRLLCKKIGYKPFHNTRLLKQALTHCSMGEANNERLEFLGDAILNFVIAGALFTQFSNLPEGDLSRLRAYLVKGDTLAEIAAELDLGDYLYLGQGELRSGAFRRSSILSDALEALFGAIYLDDGFDAAKAVILNLYNTRLGTLNLTTNLKDPKTQLQEYLQARKQDLPTYTLVRTEGIEHDQTFHVACKVNHLVTEATGTTRKKAEQQAAQLLLNQLKETK